MKQNRLRLCITITPELLEQLDQYVDDLGITKRSAIIMVAVKEYLKKVKND